MSSPLDPRFQQRLRNAGAAVGGTNPTLATGLASSDLDDEQVQLVGGFTQALDTATLARLARYSGARLNLGPTQRSQLDAIGEDYSDVDDSQELAGDSRNWLERAFDTVASAASNTMDTVLHAPGVEQAFTAFNWALDGAKLPARMLSDAFDGSNDDEINEQMLARGYDPESTASYFAFMWNQGDSLYHDLDPARSTYGDDVVDLAIEAQRDPEGFQERLPKLAPEQQALTQTPEFEKAYDAIDRQHISPGRDIARVVLPESLEDGAAFTALSGTLDAAYTLLLDPTLFAGKVGAAARGINAAGDLGRLSRVQRATGVGVLAKTVDAGSRGYFRQGLANATDAEGIRGLLTTDNAVSRGARSFIESAAKLREADKAGDTALRASIYAGMRSRHRALMPLLDEVNGGRVIKESVDEATDVATTFDRKITDVNGTKWLASNAAPIETVEEFAEYMASTAGLVRLAGGVAATRAVYLPGRINARTRLTAQLAERRARKGVEKNEQRFAFDHTKPETILPDEAEEVLQSQLDEVDRLADTSQAEARGRAIYDEMRNIGPDGKKTVAGAFRKARAKAEMRNRRITTLLPKVSTLNYADSGGTETVRNFARLYMNKSEADRIASLYAVAGEGQRRQIGQGLLEQTFHASGLSRSEAGQEFISKWRADQDAVTKRAYGLNGTDVIKTESGDRHVALYPSQISDDLVLPSFKSMQYIATKYVVGGHLAKTTGAIRAGFIGDRMDSLLRPITMGWLVSAAGGTRNALDEIGGAALRGETADLVRSRQILSASRRAGKKASLQERKAAAKVEGRLLPKIPIAMRGAADTVEQVFVAQGLGQLMRFGRKPTEEDARYVARFTDDLERNLLDEGLNGTFHNADQYVRGNEGALEMHKAGLMAVQVQHIGEKVREFDGYKQMELDGGYGLDNWANNLGQRFQDPSSPAHVALRSIMEGGDALGEVIAYMNTPAMRHFMERAEVLQTVKGTRVRPGNADDKAAAIEEYAQRMIADVTAAVRGRGREAYPDELVEKVRAWKGTAGVEKATTRAEEREAAQAQLDADIATSQSALEQARTQRDELLATDKEWRAYEKATDRVALHESKLAQAQRDLDTATGKVAGDANTSKLWIALGKQDAEVTRLTQARDAARAKRDRFKLQGGSNETRLQELRHNAVIAETRLAGAKRKLDRIDSEIGKVTGTTRDPAELTRLEARIADRKAKLEEVKATAVRPTGERPAAEAVAAARKGAGDAHKSHAVAKRSAETNRNRASVDRKRAEAGFTGHVDDPDIARYLRESGEAFTDKAGRTIVDRTINGALAEKLLAGEIPDPSWLKANIPAHELPDDAIGKVWLPVNPKHLPGQIAQGYTEVLTKAYNQVVTKQVNALSRNPMQLAAYTQARRNMAGYEKHLLDSGFNEEAAEAVVHRMARGQADALVYKSVDDPQTATQFSILARNWWAFERAQEDWLRRWGRQLRDDPTQIRKLQLAVHGGTSAGILEKDDEGNLNFVYPGSGALINGFTKLASIVGLGDMIKIPVMPDLRSNLTFINPSLDNPVGFSSTPVISLPLKALSAVMGSEYPILSASADKIVNGELGAGREWYESIMPSFVGRIISGAINEEADSQFGSAFTSAVANLEAAGALDDPELALDPSKRQAFLDALKSQVHNQMVARAVMGFFLPAAPGTPTNDVQREDGTWVQEPDFTAQKAGLASLKDEARKVFASMPFEDAMAYWAERHPNETILAPGGGGSRTAVGTTAANAPATLRAATWMQDEGSYVLENYGKGEDAVGVYFIPNGQVGTPDGEYNDVAYRAQLERGIREYKDLDDYFEGMIVRNGEATYYDTMDDYDEEIARATAQGNTARVDQLEAAKAQEKAFIYAGNPLLEQKNALFATNPARQRAVIQQLNRLLADPDAVAGIGDEMAAGTAQLLLARRQYEADSEAIKGERGYTATAARNAAKQSYRAALAGIGEQYPDLADLIRGAFRIPD